MSVREVILLTARVGGVLGSGVKGGLDGGRVAYSVCSNRDVDLPYRKYFLFMVTVNVEAEVSRHHNVTQ